MAQAQASQEQQQERERERQQGFEGETPHGQRASSGSMEKKSTTPEYDAWLLRRARQPAVRLSRAEVEERRARLREQARRLTAGADGEER